MSNDPEIWARQAWDTRNSEEERRVAATCYRAWRAEHGKVNCKFDACVKIPVQKLSGKEWICVNHGGKG